MGWMVRPWPLGPVFAFVLLLSGLDAAPGLADTEPQSSPPPAPPITVLAQVKVGKNPLGVAVHSGRAQAVVAERNDGSVSVVDLLHPGVVRRVSVGRQPSGVAVNPETNVAVVTLAAENAVALVDLDAFTVLEKLAVGRRPSGVAIDPGLNVAVVANEHGRSVSIVDLGARMVVAEILVGRRPTGVAVNPLTHLFAVTNRGDGTVTLLDLTVPTSPSVPALITLPASRQHRDHDRRHGWHHGRRAEPRGVAFDYGPSLNRFVVADSGGRAAHVVTLTATNELAAMKTLPLGRRAHAVAANPGLDSALVTADHDDVFAIALTPAVVGRQEVEQRPHGVALDPVTCRAAVTNFASHRVTILQASCAPRLDSLAPPSVRVGAAVTLSIAGSGFLPGATVNFGGQTGLTPATISSSAITIGLTASTTAGLVPVSVTSGGQTSNSLDVQVTLAPPPVLARMITSPSPAIANGDTLTVTLTGQAFAAGATVLFDGAPVTPVAAIGCTLPTCLQVNLPAHPDSTLTLQSGDIEVRVRNPDGATSSPLTIQVLNPAPTLDELIPAFVASGSADVTIDLLGSAFVSRPIGTELVAGSIVLVDGVPLGAIADPLTPTLQLTVTLPAALLATPGTRQVQVVNPTPAGGTTAALTLTVQDTLPPAGITVAPLAVPGDIPREVAVWRAGATVRGVAMLPGQGQLRLLDLTTPTAPALGAVIPITPPGENVLGDVGVNETTQTLVVTLPLLDQVALVNVSDPANPVITTVNLPWDSNPWGVAVDATTNRAIVTSLGAPPGGPLLFVIDLASATVTAQIPLPGASTTSNVAVNPLTNVAAVTDQADIASLLLVDLGAETVTATVPVGTGPATVGINPTTNTAVVANEVDDEIVIVNLATGAVVTRLAAGSQPSGVAVDGASNRALVSNLGNNEVTVVDLASNTVVDRFAMGGGVLTPRDVAWAPGTLGVAVMGTDGGDSVTVLGISAGALP